MGKRNQTYSDTEQAIYLNKLITISDLLEFKQQLLGEFKQIIRDCVSTQNSDTGKKWLKAEEVRKLLKVSTGKLYTLRLKGILPFTKIGGMIYYEFTDIESILNAKKTVGFNKS